MATVNKKMTAIADAIRERTGKTDVLSLDDMATDIPKVYEAGKKSQYDDFWDCLQYNGNRRNYIGVFSGRGWNEDNFVPKYDVVPTNARCMFAHDMDWGTSDYNGIKDLPTCLKKAGVTLDFSKCTDFHSTWIYSCVEHIGIIDTRSASSLDHTFYCSYNLHTIDEIILKDDGSQTFPYAPFYSPALANIKFTGKIGNNISFYYCPLLSYESLMSIINALKDYSGTTTTRTLTLHATAKARLSESDIAITTEKGWTIA